jgi:adenylate cyclase
MPEEAVVAFGGHRLQADPETEQTLGRLMDQLLDTLQVVSGHGSLACGADVLWAEALRRRGASLHVVLPDGDENQFLDRAVRAGGEDWVQRYHLLRAAATTVAQVPRGESWERTFRSVTDRAFDLALAEAALTGVSVSLVVVWDETSPVRICGTSADVAVWRRRELPLHVVPMTGHRIEE